MPDFPSAVVLRRKGGALVALRDGLYFFDPETERFESFPSDRRGASVRQMLGRKGEAWGAESGTERLVRITY